MIPKLSLVEQNQRFFKQQVDFLQQQIELIGAPSEDSYQFEKLQQLLSET